MVNVEQITSRLSMMPDQALQQYAMMNKNDPYVLALAVSESNRRKQMRSAAVPPAQDMPKVADQAVASMALPEDQGIGALPADMEFADGGLVAFSGGGDVAGYAPGGVTRADVDRAYQEWMSSQPSWFQQSTPLSGQREAAAKAKYENLLSQYQSTAGTSASAMQAPVAAPTSAQDLAQFDAATQAYMADRAAKQAEAPSANVPQKSGIDQLVAPKAPGVTGDMVSRAKNMAGRIYDTGGIDKLLQEKQDLVNRREAELREGLKSRPSEQAFTGLEESLKKEAEAEGGEKEQAKGMAIFKAGLAMMSGASPYALQNIGKGATAGLEDYSAAIKDFKKAAKDREKLMAEIEEKRRLQKVGDWEAAQATDEKIANLQAGIKDKMIDATVKTTGVKAEIAGNLIGKELDFNRQVQLKGMPSYENAQEQRLVQMWLKDNPGKNEIDARTALGLGLGGRQASASDRIRGYQTILNDMTATDEEKADARVKLKALIAGAQQAGGQQYAALPANATAKDLTVGTIYQTARGPAKWDGKQFMPI